MQKYFFFIKTPNNLVTSFDDCQGKFMVKMDIKNNGKWGKTQDCVGTRKINNILQFTTVSLSVFYKNVTNTLKKNLKKHLWH